MIIKPVIHLGNVLQIRRIDIKRLELIAKTINNNLVPHVILLKGFYPVKGVQAHILGTTVIIGCSAYYVAENLDTVDEKLRRLSKYHSIPVINGDGFCL